MPATGTRPRMASSAASLPAVPLRRVTAGGMQVRDLARAAGDAQTAADLEALWESLGSEFNGAFGNSTDGCYDKCSTQTALALALALGVAGNGTAATQQRLLEAVSARGGHMSVGIIGGKFLHDSLKAAGHEATALALLEQTDYPSLGFFFANTMEPATTNLWELPDALAEGTGMNSRNQRHVSRLYFVSY